MDASSWSAERSGDGAAGSKGSPMKLIVRGNGFVAGLTNLGSRLEVSNGCYSMQTKVCSTIYGLDA
jgi:hypothetical protein